MNVESPAPDPRIIVSDVDGSRWLLLLDPDRAAGCILPLVRDPAANRRTSGSGRSGIQFSWRRRG